MSDRSLAALLESEARFRAAFATAPHGMGMVSPDGRWLKVNAALCAITGYSEDEMLEMNFQKVTHPDDLDTDLDFMRQMLAGEIPSFQMEKRYIRKDGNEVPVLLSVALVRSESGEPLYTVSQILDLTHQKEADERLRRAQKMEAIGQLTGGLAHDFNNLLAIILGNLQLLDRDLAGNASARQRAAGAIDAAQRGAQLTQRLLAFSRRQMLLAEVGDANFHIDDMRELLQSSIGQNIELKTRFCGDGGWLINVDSNQFQTAILNLAVNARDAMPAGGCLTIETAEVALDAAWAEAHADVKAGDYVAVSVIDTGAGMSAAIAAQVFEPFFTTKQTGLGSGLGLSMVFGFARQSLGHVEVETGEGQGTTVTLYLPRDTSGADEARPPAAGRDDCPTGRETILVVEDNDAVREVSVLMLRRLGYTVLQAASGLDAIAMLARRRDIALLFTDIVMPDGMTGTELAAKASAAIPRLKFVFTSGYADVSEIQRIAGSAHGFVSKPFKMSDLATTIRETLDRDGLDRGARDTPERADPEQSRHGPPARARIAG